MRPAAELVDGLLVHVLDVGLGALWLAEEAAALHTAGRLDARAFEDGGADVVALADALAADAGCAFGVGPDEGDAGDLLVLLGAFEEQAMVAEVIAVVGGEDADGVALFAAGSERLLNARELGVDHADHAAGEGLSFLGFARAAALVMADFISVDYLVIIIAAIVPALAYYASLFTTVVFESRALGVKAAQEAELEPITSQDWINLILVVVPVAIVVVALISGFSAAGSAMIALSCLLVLSFLNAEMRARPIRVAASFAKGGVTFGRLLMAIGTVSIIIAVLGATGLPLEFAKVVSSNAGSSLLLALVFAALASLVLGMGMPTLPAYLTIVIILGPSLTSLGLTDLTAHFFVFYFGVASAITPPVAMAAFAAASISGGGPIGTAVQATRIGIVIFAIPFLFAYNPMMLIAAESGAEFSLLAFLYLLLRLGALIYLLASAASCFDLARLRPWEIALRIGVGLALIHPDLLINASALALALALVVAHRSLNKEAIAKSEAA